MIVAPPFPFVPSLDLAPLFVSILVIGVALAVVTRYFVEDVL